MRLSLLSAALVAALVGYGSTIALVLAAAAALGATEAQTASWVLAICLGKAVGSAFLSWRSRVPVILAWSTPGAALVAATEGITMPEAVGAFLLAGLLIALTGALKPLGRAVALIPDGIAGGMLAGVLLPFCLKLAGAAEALPLLVLPAIAVFALVRLWNPALAVLAALAGGSALAFAGEAAMPELPLALPTLTFIPPAFDPTVLIGLGLPLYLVTMASQNLPGFAVLRAAGYEPPVRSALTVTGGLSALTAPFGAHTVSMAAITAAICLGDEVHPDRSRRWIVGLVYAAVWVGLGLFGPAILACIAALPPALVTALVGLALLGPLTGALTAAFAHPEQRFAAVVTLAVTGSGVAIAGIGAAFWGLLAGLAVHVTERAARRR
ncbi:benzoate/H(+) symporter BenE family transporter [Cereibacter sphaeroides]|uniref:benzoate/H(+) symporter BenE family transporter n=1 Tax=Cereibacter sphaeroides TaxID=1063 RepID=UPI000191C619|nr:benzoate/H(+) symporter BenE family transporter [Cereibacter sphaeroides]ACM00261.1 Benzoate transporter precursor [Cereibacter sphaeroides KD131]EKX55635.1 Benzoate transport protein [Rhodobacter sp. AKP1]